MIIVQLLGGLGNQLFQYAAARALAVANNTGVLLDTTNFKTEGPRTFDLLNFHVDASVATDTEINTLKCVNSFQRVRAYLTPYAKKTFYKQPYFHFDKRFLLLRDPVYIKGYFQSEKYFDSIKELIRKELVLRDAIAPSIANLASHMGQENSVSLHVRRGDYKVNKTALKYHGIVPLSYYQTAVTLMQQRNPDAVFYIFSDDAPWVKENLQLPEVTIVSGIHTTTHFEDLFLMTQCRHNIIANSSFSWWGAWLGSDADKIVIAPKQWFHKGSRDRQDLLPSRWIQL